MALKRHMYREKALLVVLCLLFVFSSMAGIFPFGGKTANAMAVGDTVIFNGSSLPVNVTDTAKGTVYSADWNPLTDPANTGDFTYEGIKPELGVRVVPNTSQGTCIRLYEAGADQNVNGEYVSFNFNVPESHTYDLILEPFRHYTGAVFDIKLDGRLIKSNYSFNAPAATTCPPEVLLSDVRLTGGNHVVSFELKQKVLYPGNNKYYAWLYIKTLRIKEKQDIIPKLDSVSLTADETNLFKGDTSQVYLTGTMNDGSPANLGTAEVVYVSSASEVLEVNAGTGEVTARGEGTADVTAKVTLDGILKEATLRFTVQEITSSKTRSTYYTTEEVAAARENIGNYSWAKSIRDNAVNKADTYLEKGYDFWWNIITPQSIPRSNVVVPIATLGCPVCGTEINKYGLYPYILDPVNDPWKLECPNCHTKFPTNDFKAYYEGGLDEHGVFNPSIAKAHNDALITAGGTGNLVNLSGLHTDDPNWGVDDGYGYITYDDKGAKNVYAFIAYYNHWQYGYSGRGAIEIALNAFRDAYLYTGDLKYSRAGLIMLDRIADFYPDMDTSVYTKASGFVNSDGGTQKGKILGSIWETFITKEFIKAYDAFFTTTDDPELIAFLSSKADQYNLGVLKYSGAGIRRNIEDNYLRQIFTGFKNAQIRGNNGMHQSSLALAAVVFDTLPETKEWLDYDFQAGALVSNPYRVTGGNIMNALVNDVGRDGQGNEGAPGYNILWLSQYLEVADALDGYDKYPQADLYKNVKFRKMFSASYPLILSDRYFANIGDTGLTGNPGISLNKAEYIKGFEKFGDPIMAQVAYYLNGNTTDGIHSSIFTKDPYKVTEDIKNVIDTNGPLEMDSSNLSSYGYTALRDGDSIKTNYGTTYNTSMLDITDQSQTSSIVDSNGAVLFNGTGAGDYISFEFSVPANDEYEIDIKPSRATSYGAYNVKIDDQVIGQLDFFGGVSEMESLGEYTLTEGLQQITFECTGKNASSSGYKMGVIQLALLNDEARAQRDADSNENTLRDVWMTYGKSKLPTHGHKDALSIGLHAFGLDMAPDLGYPEDTGAGAHRTEWVSNTVSHNTVVVDRSKQADEHLIGESRHFDDSDKVKLLDVEAPVVYPQTDIYRRTTALIKVDDANSYTVDFFRVKGGDDHVFSFHGAEGDVSVEGLNLVDQPTGTYAGPDVQFGVRPANDSVPGNYYAGSGFHWLKDVQKDENPSDIFSVDWDVKDTWNALLDPENIHLKLTMLGDADDVAIADGVPPRNKPGNPASLKYLLVHRSGTDLDSLFTSVIEPYKDQSFIESISPVEVKENGAAVSSSDVKAVKVTLTNGRVDYVIYALDPGTTYTIDDRFEFKGFFGVYSETDGVVVEGYLNDGTTLGDIVTNTTPRVTGTIADFTKDMSLDNKITENMAQDFDVNNLAGRYIYVNNGDIGNATYKINGAIVNEDKTVTLDIGDVTLIKSWADVNDYSKGYNYDIAADQSFYIPLSVEKLSHLSTVLLTSDATTLHRGDESRLTVSAAYESGAPVDMDETATEFVSTDAGVVSIKDGMMTAVNPGTAGIYAEVTLNGVTVRSNTVIVNVSATAESVGNTLERFIQSGELKGSLAMQLSNSLDQAGHFIEKGQTKQAAKHLDDLIKHLNNKAMEANVTENAKKIISLDINALIDSLSMQ